MTTLPWRVLCADGELYCTGATLAEAEELLSEADRECLCGDQHAIDAMVPPNRHCRKCRRAGRDGHGHNTRTCWFDAA